MLSRCLSQASFPSSESSQVDVDIMVYDNIAAPIILFLPSFTCSLHLKISLCNYIFRQDEHNLDISSQYQL